MYKNRSLTGRNNLCGEKIKQFRLLLSGKPSQREFADMLQLAGLDVDKNAVQRIESGERFVTDIELVKIADVLGVTLDDLVRE